MPMPIESTGFSHNISNLLFINSVTRSWGLKTPKAWHLNWLGTQLHELRGCWEITTSLDNTRKCFGKWFATQIAVHNSSYWKSLGPYTRPSCSAGGRSENLGVLESIETLPNLLLSFLKKMGYTFNPCNPNSAGSIILRKIRATM